MTISSSLLRSALVCLTAVALTGCLPATQSDEEREPHFLAGKSRISSMDYKGAIESFEKALEVNPQSAAAHFELACLFDRREADPAAAIYHYKHYLDLRLNAENAEIVNQRILACKQELARTVVLGPVTEKVQKELDQLAQENKRLNDENKRLHEDLDKWTAYAAQLQQLTNRSVAAVRIPQPLASVATTQLSAANVVSANDRRTQSPGTSTRTHTIKPGDTPSTIAKRYGIRIESLMAANPKVDARRLQIGQSLVIPTS